jgi:hypothetical protein
MDGSALVPVVLPIVALPLLALWLFAVYHANAHPQYPARNVPDAARARLEVAILTEREQREEREQAAALSEAHAATESPPPTPSTQQAALGAARWPESA